jgi:ornithine--oxo-acid transaminase
MLTETMAEKSTREFVELEHEFGAHNYHPLDIVIERAEGVWVYDVEGKRYLDCLAAYIRKVIEKN